MTKGSRLWWLPAIVLSLLLHALLFISFTQQRVPAAEQLQSAVALASVRLSFLQLPKPQPGLKPDTMPEQEPEREQMTEPEPIAEPEPQPEPIPEPKAKSAPKPKPLPKPKSKPKAESKSEPKQQANPPAFQPPPATQLSEPKTRPVSAAELKQRYLAALLSRIEARKSYPNAARRRAIEGRIAVSFTLACDGSVNAVEIPTGHKLLRVSAAEALQRAQPFPQPPTGVDCPFRVNYAMAFELQ